MGIMAVSPRLSCCCCRKPHVQKVVVSIKFEQGPPADSWSWGKYGQKPIKGSPHPRSYYKCSSYRGCPARKQVEKCRSESTRLIVTYTTDQNHQSYARVQRKNKIITLTRVTQVLSSTMACHLLNQQLHLPSSVVKRSRDFFDELEELLPVSASPCQSLAFMVQEQLL